MHLIIGSFSVYIHEEFSISCFHDPRFSNLCDREFVASRIYYTEWLESIINDDVLLHVEKLGLSCSFCRGSFETDGLFRGSTDGLQSSVPGR